MVLFLKALLKHIIIFSLISAGMLLITFISSQFNTLHPDAYRDGVMSVVYVYVIVLIVHVLIVVLRKTTRFDAFKLPMKLVKWHKDTGVFVHIAVLFTLITVINSIMMITGIDTPKTGTFAYTHLLVRTLIVTLAVVISMFKDVLENIKSIARWFKSETKDFAIKQYLTVSGVFSKSVVMFTTITVLGCVMMVLLSTLINPQGGYNLYLSLVILYGVLLIVSFIHEYFLNKPKRT